MNYAILYLYLKYIIVIEFALVFLLILAILLLRLWIYFQNKRKSNIIQQIKQYLQNLIETNEESIKLTWQRRWLNLEILLDIVEIFDKAYQNKMWKKIKLEILFAYMLPLARKKSGNRKWLMRYRSARTLALSAEPQDEKIIIKLLQDKIPMVYLNAAIAAVKFGSFLVLKELIQRMSLSRRVAKSVFLNAFENPSENISAHIYKILNAATDPYLKATCYKVLTYCPNSSPYPGVIEDIESSVLELRLDALRFFAYSEQTKAVPILTKLLQDSSWEVRVVAIQLLGKLKAKQAIPEIERLLQDSVWWVRVNAAQCLKNFGEAGIKVLKAQDPKIDRFAYEAAMHVLHLPKTILVK